MTSKPRGHIHYADEPLLTEFRINPKCTDCRFKMLDIYRNKYGILFKQCVEEVRTPHAVVYSRRCAVDNDLTLLMGRRRCGETVCTDLEPECQ